MPQEVTEANCIVFAFGFSCYACTEMTALVLDMLFFWFITVCELLPSIVLHGLCMCVKQVIIQIFYVYTDLLFFSCPFNHINEFNIHPCHTKLLSQNTTICGFL